MTDKPDTDAAVRFVIDNWETLGVEDHQGILHKPASIKRRNAKGSITETAVMLRHITNQQRFRARTLGRAYALELQLDLDRDRELVEQIDNFAILTFAIRDCKTYDQHVSKLDDLLRLYDSQALIEVWEAYNIWVEMLDPRFGEMDGEQLWQTIVRVAREKNPSPFAGMPGHAQFTCIVLMAQEALHSPNRPSWLQPPEISRRAS